MNKRFSHDSLAWMGGLALLLVLLLPGRVHAQEQSNAITHGPLLGRPSADGVGVWVRTSEPTSFQVHYRSDDGDDEGSARGETNRRRDNSGWIQLDDLEPSTDYSYEVQIPGTAEESTRDGTFHTLPSAAQHHHPEHNPEGLFNFEFTHGSCNFQYRRGDSSRVMPAYQTMRKELEGEVDFQIMNGDFIYEARRGTSVEEWQEQNGVSDAQVPEVLHDMPRLAGVWENYKLYLDRGPYLSGWHRNVPALFTFDDHELFNDIKGTGTPGYRNRKAVYRDIGVQGWYDYLGWSNPLPPGRDTIRYGRASLDAEQAVLTDPEANFRDLQLDQLPTLLVHWNDDHPSAGVYEASEVLSEQRLRLNPAPSADGDELAYSIGQPSYFSFRVSNAEFFVLDTRSHRGLHEKDNPDKEGLSMLGDTQRQWLIEGMQESDADLFFVVSTVSFTIPHIDPNQPNKDESWTVYLDEREQLIEFWDEMDEPIFLLTGDLHNSIVAQVTDNVREYVSGPQNSPNHPLEDEGSRPPSGPFTYNGREVDIQWSSFWMSDVPGRYQQQPYYSVVQVNNVFKNPGPDDEERWVAYPEPQVVIQYYDGLTGELAYAESIKLDGDGD